MLKQKKMTKYMKKEKIIRIWRFAYCKLFEMADSFKDKKNEWDLHKIIWRFYWLIPNK